MGQNTAAMQIDFSKNFINKQNEKQRCTRLISLFSTYAWLLYTNNLSAVFVNNSLKHDKYAECTNMPLSINHVNQILTTLIAIYSLF